MQPVTLITLKTQIQASAALKLDLVKLEAEIQS